MQDNSVTSVLPSPIPKQKAAWTGKILSRMSARARTVAALFCVFAIFFAVTVSIQLIGNIYSSELSAESDGPAHYVTAVMVYDYIREGLPHSPLTFAQNYYAHYPKIAIGHWPPAFYVVQALWMFLFGHSITADLVLMAAFCAALATSLYWSVHRAFQSTIFALFAGLCLVLLPHLRAFTSTVMADLPIALFSMLAVFCWIKYLEIGKSRYALAFVFFLALTIFTKPNGLALLLFVPFSVILTRRFDRLLNVWLCIGVAGVALTYFGWFLFTKKFVVQTMHYSLSPDFVLQAAGYYSRTLIAMTGGWVNIFTLIGLSSLLWESRRGLDSFWGSILALLLAVYGFHCFVPAGLEPRFMLAAMVPMVLLMVRGLYTAASVSAFIPLPVGARFSIFGIVALVLVLVNVLPISPRRRYGLADAAEFISSHADLSKAVTMVSSEGEGEGMFISEMAQRDSARPSHIVVRAYHALADSDWTGRKYSLRVTTPDQVMAFVRKLPVGLLIMDRTDHTHPNQHQQLLERTIAVRPNEWKVIAVFGGTSLNNSVAIYRRTVADLAPHHPVVIDVRGTIHQTFIIPAN